MRLHDIPYCLADMTMLMFMHYGVANTIEVNDMLGSGRFLGFVTLSNGDCGYQLSGDGS